MTNFDIKSKVIIIVGATGQGKSPLVRQIIGKKRNCYLFDYQDEYGEKTKYPGQVPDLLPTDINLPRCRDIRCDVKLFVEQAFRRKNTVVVFEDATGFVQGRISDEFKRLLTNKFFSHNTYVLVFHSIVDIPLGVMRLADYLIMLPTNDEIYAVEKRYPSLAEKYKTIRKNKIEVIKLI